MYRTTPTEGGCELPGEICRPPVGPKKVWVGGPAGEMQCCCLCGPDLGLSTQLPDLGGIGAAQRGPGGQGAGVLASSHLINDLINSGPWGP